ncbi:MAG: hypothetical protein M3347_11930 [Armatimonadota bacterium]|nr:hypothetical protein [Armatimonadota bacterium]
MKSYLTSLVLSLILHLAVATHGDEVPNREPVDVAPAEVPQPTAQELLEDSRFSMTLQNAPLSRMLALLETTTPVRFRYGAPPDAVVTTSFQDAPLFPTLESLLRKAGFQMRRVDADIFLFQRAANAQVSTWRYWNRPGPPPANWTNPQASLPVPQKVAAASNSPARNEAAWRPVDVAVDANRRPGVIVTLPTTSDSAVLPVWLRWPLTLRHVPRGAQLMLETPAEATLYVNGAALLRRWKGRRLIDLDQVLQRGHNCLAIRWRAGRSEERNATPLLRYEWFFVNKFDDPESLETQRSGPDKPKVSAAVKLKVDALTTAPPRRRRRR